LNFVHVNGASDEKFLPEIIGAGGLFLDFDNDGWLDVFLVDGGSLADPALARPASAAPGNARAATAWPRRSSP
jgi:hypothetical protein